MYIYDFEGWPDFHWNNKNILEPLMPLYQKQGKLIGGMQSLGFNLSEEAVLLSITQEVVKSSEIEGEILDKTQVRSSVARHLGMEKGALSPIDRNVEGVVEMMLDATQNFDQPLTKERLFNWHASLFPTGRSGFSRIRVGMWRTGIVEVVSGQAGKEKIHFEGPPASRVDHEISIFLDWCNHETKVDPIIKAAIAHLWFVTIHPFEDGNGRIARAIGDMMLARSEKSSQRFYSLSAQIQLERKSYYTILEQTQKGNLDITFWLEWFVTCLGRAIDKAHIIFENLLQKARFFESLSETELNVRQRKVLNLLFEGFEGKLTSSKWAKLNKCSQDTAYRDILDLLNRGIFVKNSEGGRNTSYSLAKLKIR